ncbi:non-ribosomal peptide synthetase [Chamaesiphon sp. OTE_75_metabat_556]|uniref:non-ribosomal peptide synthetase n=1 Tax=Chamaesiphon sp. OTE_75_metabat_556 TaxID=2964692 RepID=UPI00286C4174|nr:non-ribosomal peptide synthetase [Chamaesiphon sp. OTE_75_metabat_556]
MSLANSQQQILTEVAKITRHDVEDLEPDLFLESDLGVDSIKMVEIVNGLIQLVPEQQKTKFLESVPVTKLMQLQTIREIINTTQPWLAAPKPDTDLVTNIAGSAGIETLDEQPLQQTTEILDSQYFLLLGHWIVNSSSLFATVRLQGQFDIQLAGSSWQALIDRHPMLRAYFTIPEQATSFQEYQLEILTNPTAPAILTKDLRHLHPAETAGAIEQELTDWLNFNWSLTTWPLHQFTVLQIEESVCQLIFANEHLIADGLSNQQILREFLEIYQATAEHRVPHLPAAVSATTYSDCVRQMNAFQAPDRDKILLDYVHVHGKESYVWNPTQTAITPAQINFQNQAVCLDKTLTQNLIAKTKEWRLPLNSLLVTAFLKAISAIEIEPESFMLQIPTSGRIYPEVDATDIVGSFAQNLALRFDRPHHDETWEILLDRVHQTIQDGLVNDYDKIQNQQIAQIFREKIPLVSGKLPAHLVGSIAQILKSNIFLPFTGQTHLKQSYGSLQILEYRAGGINAPGTLDILQEIFNDRLHLFASHDRQSLPAAVIKNLLQKYVEQLQALTIYNKPDLVEQHSASDRTSLAAVDRHDLLDSVTQIVSKICHQALNDKHLDLDLEMDLGIDSLELVRIVTQLEKKVGKIDRRALLNCRSVREIVAVLAQNQIAAEPTLGSSTSSKIPYVEISQQSLRTPEAIAVLAGTNTLTYQQLHQQSNQVAHYLRTQGVKPGVLVGIMVHQSPLMWVGILGILKAGGAYVPIDSNYPVARIRYMLDHAEIGILLTEHQLIDQFQACYQEQLPLNTVLFLDKGQPCLPLAHLHQIQQQQWSTYSLETPSLLNHPEDLMTVLYTSGSTGRPKGVMLNHQGYMNRLNWMQKTFQLTPGDRVAQKTSCCFDISVWEIFWPLMVGATVCPVSRDVVRDPWSLAPWMQENKINILHFVPSLFGEFLEALEDKSNEFPDLRWLIFSGEALPMPFIQQWLDKYGDRVGLANLYGPTEASIDVTCHLIQSRPGSKGENSIPIGQAIDNVYLEILDEQLQPLPQGNLGELYLGGIQLAQGYLKDPEKTAAAFPANPFTHIPSENLYRTGDLAKQLPDGSFEYHGRIDSQVKIRGFRVELGEIENILISHPNIKEAAVVALDYELGQKRLVAGLAGEPVAAQIVKAHLAKHLPHYMIPHRLEWLPNLPKNHNGKLDRQALITLFQAEQSPPTESQDEYLPAGPGQRWIFAYFEPPYQWAGYSRFRYHQPLDAEVFRQSFQHLVEIHPSLRTIFVQKEGKWWQQVLPPSTPANIVFYDGTQHSEQQRDCQIQGLIQQLSGELKIDRGPLFQVIIVKINDRCYEIVMLGHHLNGDMLSSQLIFQQLWLTYHRLIGSQSESPQPLAPKASYLDFTRLLMAAEQQGKLASHPYYWLFQFPSEQSVFQVPCDRHQGVNLEISAREEKWVLSEANSTTLLTQAKSHYQSNVYSLLLAPLYRLMGQWSQRADVAISHRSHGRDLGDGNQFFEAMGNFAVNFPIGISVDAQLNWGQLIQQIQEKFAGLPMNGITFDWIGSQLPNYLYPDNNLTPVRANYLGNRTLPQSDIFEFMPEESDRRLSQPDRQRTTLLEFFFSIVDGNLTVTIEYSDNFHLQSTIQELGASYISLLEDLLVAVPTTKAKLPLV